MFDGIKWILVCRRKSRRTTTTEKKPHSPFTTAREYGLVVAVCVYAWVSQPLQMFIFFFFRYVFGTLFFLVVLILFVLNGWYYCGRRRCRFSLNSQSSVLCIFFSFSKPCKNPLNRVLGECICVGLFSPNKEISFCTFDCNFFFASILSLNKHQHNIQYTTSQYFFLLFFTCSERFKTSQNRPQWIWFVFNFFSIDRNSVFLFRWNHSLNSSNI